MRLINIAGNGIAMITGMIATPVMAQTVDPTRPVTVVAALQEAGYKAVLSKDSVGDPKITSSANGAAFTVYFYGCEANAGCKTVQMAAGYTIKVKPTPAKINEWNANNRFATAYLDKDGDPHIQFDVVLVGGMSAQLFGEAVNRWTDSMGAFQSFVGW